MHGCTGTYGTAQFKLDIYMRVAMELFNKYVKLLVSYMPVHDNSILDPRKLCTREVHYLRAMYRMLHM